MQNFQKLDVYQNAYSLSRQIYEDIKDSKHFRLKEQLFGSSTAICANLAEMAAFENKSQQKQKVIVCIGEANETEFWLDFCKDTELLSQEKHKLYVNELHKIRMKLFNLLKSIKMDIGEKD